MTDTVLSRRMQVVNFIAASVAVLAWIVFLAVLAAWY
jgi:hypothetical protein